jgi:hypothetical protein
MEEEIISKIVKFTGTSELNNYCVKPGFFGKNRFQNSQK